MAIATKWWSLVVDRWSKYKTVTCGRGSWFKYQFAILLLAMYLFSPPLYAQPQQPTSTDDVDQELFGEKTKEKKAEDGVGQGGDALQEQLRRELGAAGVKEDDNPVLDIARRMLDVQSHIADADAGQNVQNEQKQIIADLDKLIEQAKKSCNSSGSCSKPGQSSSRTPSNSAAKKPGSKPGNKPSEKPSQQSSQRPPDKKILKPDPAEMRNLIKDLWGELPQNVREQMLQNPTEQFVPQYETMIEEYYRRLSEDKRE